MTTKKSKKKEGFFSKIAIDLMGFIIFFLRIIPRFIALIEYEVKDAIKSVYLILTLTVISVLLLFSAWIGLQAMLVVYLIKLNITLLISLTLVVILNIILLAISLLYISHTKSHLTFRYTRKLIKDLRVKN